MIARWLHNWTENLPMRLIAINGEPYLERYWIGSPKRPYTFKFFGREITTCLHHFVTGDGDHKAHDHPFRALSFVLSGSYLEERVLALSPVVGYLSKLRRVRWFNKLWPMDFHRVVRYEGDVWTLFMHGPRLEAPGAKLVEKEWGFLERVSGGLNYRQPYDVAATKEWQREGKNRAQVYAEFYEEREQLEEAA